MLLIGDLVIEVLSVEYLDTGCCFKVRLSTPLRKIVTEWHCATDKIDLRGEFNCWLQIAKSDKPPEYPVSKAINDKLKEHWQLCRSKALELFGDEETLQRYAE